MDIVKSPEFLIRIVDDTYGMKLEPIEAEMLLGYLEGSDFCLLSSGRYDCDCQKLPPFGVPCRGTFVVEAGLCISGSR